MTGTRTGLTISQTVVFAMPVPVLCEQVPQSLDIEADALQIAIYAAALIDAMNAPKISC